jgi:hypothetical protein
VVKKNPLNIAQQPLHAIETAHSGKRCAKVFGLLNYRSATMSNFATSMMADIVTYARQLRGWPLFVWCMFSPQKWWVHGYERGWKAALQLVESSKQDVQQPHAVKVEDSHISETETSA